MDTIFYTELKERSILGNRPQIFYVTVSFDIALCMLPPLGCQPGNDTGMTRREENILHFNRNWPASCRAEPTRSQQRQRGLRLPWQGQRGTNTHVIGDRVQTSLSYCNIETFTLNLIKLSRKVSNHKNCWMRPKVLLAKWPGPDSSGKTQNRTSIKWWFLLLISPTSQAI